MNNGKSLETCSFEARLAGGAATGRPTGTRLPYSVTYYDVMAGRERIRRFSCKDRARAFQLGLRIRASDVGRVMTRKAK